MKFIYVLEDDERIQKDLFDTLKSIDPQLCIRFFKDLELFHTWLKLAMNEGPLALARGGEPYKEDMPLPLTPAPTHELRLVIAKNELLGVKNMGLIKRAQEFFLRKKICSSLDPTSLILTAFDSPDFDIKLAEERVINNVIFKPFDKLILKQHLEYALTGHHPVNSETISAIQIKSTIEMLKEVSIQNLSELGFTTLNNHEIKIGAFSKYYSDLFKSGDRKSALAFCKSCKEISPTEFLCEFHFFGIDSEQISGIRRHILQNKAHKTVDLKNTHGKNHHILILSEDERITQEITNLLNDKFSNDATLYDYTHLSQLLADLGGKETVRQKHLPGTFDMVFANADFLEGDKKKFWEGLLQQFKDRQTKSGIPTTSEPELYIVSRQKMAVDSLKELTSWSKDVFFTPLDKNYVYKKIVSHCPYLLNKESTSVASLNEHQILKVANPVEITQISEAGIILKYYRAISIGAFREFILWRPNESETPEIIGTVNFHEKDKNGQGVFLNHFVFFGMKDYYLKHIRLWLREAYIRGKEK